MNIILLKDVAFKLNEGAFYEHIRMEKGSRRAKPIENILLKACEIPMPKVLYSVVEPKIIDENYFELEHMTFRSPEVVSKIKKYSLVIPNIVTAGIEIEEYCLEKESVLEQYIIMELCNFAYYYAQEAMAESIKKTYGISLVDCSYPGEDGFSLKTGKGIISLFKDRIEEIGVSFSEMGLPNPSRTGYSISFG
ncbi:MAG: hypothetical protein ACRCU3_06785 [Eubacteriaceae bacterium]